VKRILVAYDGDEPAQRALEQAAELAQAFEAELGVVSVTPWRGVPFANDPFDDAEEHARVLKSAADWLQGRGISARLYSPSGDPGRSVENVADRDGFDTIVVGSRGLGPVERIMHRSVSEYLATNAKATLVIAR
jgi:nucleotide-binding universal stress UspA family protein